VYAVLFPARRVAKTLNAVQSSLVTLPKAFVNRGMKNKKMVKQFKCRPRLKRQQAKDQKHRPHVDPPHQHKSNKLKEKPSIFTNEPKQQGKRSSGRFINGRKTKIQSIGLVSSKETTGGKDDWQTKFLHQVL
jgi:hypothetical protein